MMKEREREKVYRQGRRITEDKRFIERARPWVTGRERRRIRRERRNLERQNGDKEVERDIWMIEGEWRGLGSDHTESEGLEKFAELWTEKWQVGEIERNREVWWGRKYIFWREMYKEWNERRNIKDSRIMESAREGERREFAKRLSITRRKRIWR
jgi:hypothetical protein